jgi:hypothetical protein
MAECRSCHAVIFWGQTPNGRRAPFDPDGQNHFVTCPDRRQWRREATAEPEQAELFDAAEPGMAPKPEGSRYPL